jgi:GT2 family glycosyltransferase
VTAIDVVVVSYNSRAHLRSCVEPLAGIPDIRVIVADNASPDAGLEAIADLPVTRLQLDRNGGFSYGCNHGWRSGDAPYVLFLNPDAQMDEDSIRALVAVLEAAPDVAMAGPRMLDAAGGLILTRRRFPRPATTFARALFINRLLPNAAWTSELIPDEDGLYDQAGHCDWISGACMLVRRSVLE